MTAERGKGGATGAPDGARAKRRFKKRWLALLVPVLLLVALRVGGVWVARKAIFPVNDTPVVASGAGLPPEYRRDVLAYPSSDGVTLRGALAKRAKDARAPTIVFFHGNGESAESEAAFLGDLGRQLGVDVLSAEYRGYGGCPGEPSESALIEDGRAAVRAVGRDPKDVVLAGWSLGTAVAVALAREGLGKSVVLLAPFTSIPDVVDRLAHDPRLAEQLEAELGERKWLVGPALFIARSPLRDFVIADTFASGDRIGDVEVPVFVVHGDADDVVAVDMGETLAKKARRGTFVKVEGASHFLLERPQVLEAFRAAIAE